MFSIIQKEKNSISCKLNKKLLGQKWKNKTKKQTKQNKKQKRPK